MGSSNNAEDAGPPSWWGLVVALVAITVAIAVGQFTFASLAEAAGASVGALIAGIVLGWKYRRARWFIVFLGGVAVVHGAALWLIPWPKQHDITKLDGTFFVADVAVVLILLMFFGWLHERRHEVKNVNSIELGSCSAHRPANGSADYFLQQAPLITDSLKDGSSADEFDKTRSRSASRYVSIAIIIAVTVVMLFQFEFDNTTEVTPDHSAVVMNGAIIGAAVAALTTFVLTIGIKFKRDTPAWLSALFLSLAAAVWAGLVTMFAIDRVFQYVDFPSSKIVQSVAYLPIERAYRTGHRTTDYNVQLAGPFANLDIDARDYAAAFHDAEDVNPVGFCLRATIQRSGEAMRIMNSSVKPFPIGSVVNCPR